MPRSPRLLAVLLLASGGSGLPDCGARAPAPPAAPPRTATPDGPSAAAPSRRSLAPEVLEAKRWWVILSSSAMPGEGSEGGNGGEVLEALRRTGLPARPRRLSTTGFRELRPCLEVTVAETFADRAQALDYQARLSEVGVVADVKYAGPLEPGGDPACLAGTRWETELLAGLGARRAPRFVESHAGRTFMLLGEARDSRVLEPMDVRRGVWMAPEASDPSGHFAPGDTVDVYGTEGRVHEGCAVKGFAWLNRGMPALDYFLREPPPAAPGCGRAWAFAELDCAPPPEGWGKVWGFALPTGTPAPVFFKALPGPREGGAPAEARDEHLAALEAALQSSPRFAALRSEASLAEERVGEALDVEVHSFAYGSGPWRATFSVARFRVGEGHSRCGMDYDQQLTRVVVEQPGAGERVLPWGELPGDDVVGVLDLEGDGHPELLLRTTWPEHWMRLVREDGTEVAGAWMETCDSGC